MTIQCPHCQATISGEANPGDEIECPNCGKSFAAPEKRKFVLMQTKAERKFAEGCKAIAGLCILTLIVSFVIFAINHSITSLVVAIIALLLSFPFMLMGGL